MLYEAKVNYPCGGLLIFTPKTQDRLFGMCILSQRKNVKKTDSRQLMQQDAPLTIVPNPVTEKQVKQKLWSTKMPGKVG